MTEPLAFRCHACGALNRVALIAPGREAVCGRCKADLDISGAPAHVNLDELDRTVASSPVLVLVDFWADWCAPCRAFAPTLEVFAREQGGRVVTLKLDTEAYPGGVERFGVKAIPTLVAFRGGHEVERFSGVLTLGELRRFVAAAQVKVRL